MVNFSKPPTPTNLPTLFFNKYKRLFFLFFLFNCFAGISTYGQQKITGVVSNNSGSPLFGATVTILGTTIAATTLSDGSFTFNANTGDVLEISFIGYRSIRVKVRNETTLKISLAEAVINLDEIVVTGYTSQKVKEITGSVAVVKPKDLTTIPAGQVVPMLQGRVAGLYVTSSGQPGGGSNIRLHGIGNFGNVTPLFIIDGVQGDIDNLNPDDIESLQVLKDAGAYAIYGVRGANGVIVVTTKKGRTNKPTISYNFYMGLQMPLEKGLNYLNPHEEADLAWLQYKNSGLVNSSGNPSDLLYGTGPKPVLPDYIVAGKFGGFFEGDPAVDPKLYNLDYTRAPVYQIVRANKTGTDWFHELFSPALNQNHTISVSGTNDKSHYLFSLGYLNQQGTVLNTYLKRYTVRVNTEFNVKNKIRIGENIQLAYRDNPKVGSDYGNNPISHSANASSIMPVYDIMGNWATDAYPGTGPGKNPLGERVLSKDNINSSWDIFGNVYAEADFLKYFTARTNFGGTITNYYFNSYDHGSFDPLSGGYNSLIETAGFRNSWTWTNTLNFSRIFAKKNSVKVLIGTEAINNYNREIRAGRSNFFSNNPVYRLLSNGTNQQVNTGFAGHSSLFSCLSRIDYSFDEKYLFTATLRRDGSSVFAEQSRYGWFPSFAGAWRISGEKFMKELSWVAELKLRTSWGITGFDGNTDPDNQYSLFGTSAGRSFYDISGTSTRPQQGFYAVRSGNAETSWQQDVVTNIGLDGILWNGKVSFATDWYIKKSTGLLYNLAIPAVFGGATPPNVNIGNVQNKGVDLLLGSKGIFSKNWHWDVNATFTKYKNKIIHLNNINYFTDGHAVRSEVGYPTGQFYGYKITGLFQDSAEVAKSPIQAGAAPGKFKYYDADSNGTINDNDRVYIGNPNPDFTLGINIAITYKNFDFSTFLFGSFGNDLFNFVNPHGGNKALLYQSWLPNRTNTDIPITVINAGADFSSFAAFNSFNVEKGSYMRNKSMMLGYTFPRAFLNRLNINHFRIYFQVLNLFTITKYSGLDPEVIGTNTTGNYAIQTKPVVDFGIDAGNYPNNQKQYLIGLNLNF
jgi:TonB-linked SusC/RagA family outer membrane protein